MIPHILLGNTDISISRVGLGTMKFGRNQKINYPQTFELPSDKQMRALLSYAKDLGINLLDTAPAYGLSEERLGNLLRKENRHAWVLSTKVGEEFINGDSQFDFSPHAVQKSIERSLQRLNTDYLDVVLIHSNGEDKKIIEENEIFVTLGQLKKTGLIRAIGMSSKTVEGGILAVNHADVVMVTFNLAQTEEQPVIAYAQKENKGVFIKKALASGHLHKLAGQDPVRAALQFIFQEPGISSVILGTLSTEHLKYNVECVESVLGL